MKMMIADKFESFQMNMKKVILTCISVNFIAIGIGVYLQANIGTDSITLISDGLHRFLNTSFGVSSLIFNSFFISLAMLFNRKDLGLGTIFSAFLTGFLIDFYIGVISSLNINYSFFLINVIFMCLGQILLCFGFSLLIQLHLGMSGLDAVINYLLKTTKLSYRQIRIVFDITFSVLGVCMGGVFGIGTLFSVCTTGVLIQIFTKIIQKFM